MSSMILVAVMLRARREGRGAENSTRNNCGIAAAAVARIGACRALNQRRHQRCDKQARQHYSSHIQVSPTCMLGSRMA